MALFFLFGWVITMAAKRVNNYWLMNDNKFELDVDWYNHMKELRDSLKNEKLTLEEKSAAFDMLFDESKYKKRSI